MALNKEKIFEYVKLDDVTPVQKLSLVDQLRVLIKRLTYDESASLKRDDFLAIERLTLEADLTEFILRATEALRNGKKRYVRMQISSEFSPVLDNVLNADKFSKYYTSTLTKPNIEYDIKFFYLLEMEVL